MYYMFGFLFLVAVILVITCSETTILLCYFHLAAEVMHSFFASRFGKTIVKSSVRKNEPFLTINNFNYSDKQ